MDNNLNYVSEDDMKVIENIEIDKETKVKIKKKKDGIIYKELLNKALDKVRDDLTQDEYIEEYIIGRDYKTDTTRIMTTAAGMTVGHAYIGHPIFDWSSKLVLIKTNKRILMMQTAQYFKYLKHFEVENKVTIFTDKKELYLVIEDMNGKEVILETLVSNKKNIIDKFEENNICYEITNKKFECKEKKLFNKENKAFWIVALIILGVFLFKLATEGLSMWGY